MVFSSLTVRFWTVCTNSQVLHKRNTLRGPYKGVSILTGPLIGLKPKATINTTPHRPKIIPPTIKSTPTIMTNISNSNIHVVVPYAKGLRKTFKNIWGKMGIQVHFKGDYTIRSLLVTPKDKYNITQTSGVIYRYKFVRLKCDEEYVGESARTYGERLKECFRVPSPIHDHANTPGHHIRLDNFSIMDRESHNLTRIIKEAMNIRVNNPSLNRNIWKYQLSHTWDEVLFNNPNLKLK